MTLLRTFLLTFYNFVFTDGNGANRKCKGRKLRYKKGNDLCLCSANRGRVCDY